MRTVKTKKLFKAKLRRKEERKIKEKEK